jgi:hypothetical protein
VIESALLILHAVGVVLALQEVTESALLILHAVGVVLAVQEVTESALAILHAVGVVLALQEVIESAPLVILRTVGVVLAVQEVVELALVVDLAAQVVQVVFVHLVVENGPTSQEIGHGTKAEAERPASVVTGSSDLIQDGEMWMTTTTMTTDGKAVC